MASLARIGRAIRANKENSEEGDSTEAQVGTAAIVVFVLVYLTLNIVGTVYYSKIVSERVPVPSGERGWDLASVILGWLMFPILNISSPISYSVHK